MDKSPLQWAITPLRKYATFSGRAPRAEIWWYFFALTLLVVAIWFGLVRSVLAVAAANGAPESGAMALFGGVGLIGLVIMLAVMVPTAAVQVRRLHDIGRSGWWVGGYYILYAVYLLATFGVMGTIAASGDANTATGLVMFIGVLGLAMFAYFIVLLVFFILPGTKGANQYGPDPYGSDYGEVFR